MQQPAQIPPPYGGLTVPTGTAEFEIEYPERLSRLLIFVKWLAIIPHLLVLWVLGIGFAIVTFIAFFAILFTGKYPRGLWDYSIMYLRWSQNVGAYFLLMRDEYPPFAAGPYPVHLELAYPDRLSRLLIFVKWLLVIPHLFILYFLGLAAGFVVVIAWFAILFTGKYPRGMFDFAEGVIRWSLRVNVYTYLMTDTYPPFSLE